MTHCSAKSNSRADRGSNEVTTAGFGLRSAVQNWTACRPADRASSSHPSTGYGNAADCCTRIAPRHLVTLDPYGPSRPGSGASKTDVLLSSHAELWSCIESTPRVSARTAGPPDRLPRRPRRLVCGLPYPPPVRVIQHVTLVSGRLELAGFRQRPIAEPAQPHRPWSSSRRGSHPRARHHLPLGGAA